MHDYRCHRMSRLLQIQKRKLAMLGNRYLPFCITSLFLIVLILDCSWSLAQQPSLEKVRLAYPARSLSALHIQVAQEKGIYRKYGLQKSKRFRCELRSRWRRC